MNLWAHPRLGHHHSTFHCLTEHAMQERISLSMSLRRSSRYLIVNLDNLQRLPIVLTTSKPPTRPFEVRMSVNSRYSMLILGIQASRHFHAHGYERSVSIEPPSRHSSPPFCPEYPSSFWRLRAPVLGRSLDLFRTPDPCWQSNLSLIDYVQYNAELRSSPRGVHYMYV